MKIDPMFVDLYIGSGTRLADVKIRYLNKCCPTTATS